MENSPLDFGAAIFHKCSVTNCQSRYICQHQKSPFIASPTWAVARTAALSSVRALSRSMLWLLIPAASRFVAGYHRDPWGSCKLLDDIAWFHYIHTYIHYITLHTYTYTYTYIYIYKYMYFIYMYVYVYAFMKFYIICIYIICVYIYISCMYIYICIMYVYIYIALHFIYYYIYNVHRIFCLWPIICLD